MLGLANQLTLRLLHTWKAIGEINPVGVCDYLNNKQALIMGPIHTSVSNVYYLSPSFHGGRA